MQRFKKEYLYIILLNKMVEGTVKFFNRTKSYGFIDGDDGTSYFVHETGLKAGTAIDEGDRVSFNAVEGEKGPKAEEVEKLEGKADAGEAEEEAPAEADPKESPAEEPADEEAKETA